ncbi:hypothetical protein TCAL_07055 [Tigriopus californicus]|uniref:RNA helicase n=1 Tax=Tigriopus californicus TaxID=6832 RepID=A0A553PP03_TIGCA|nr:probable ATP-dependent RNA helicase DDX20 [Tigriopus californicus]TRY79411.1 hypothetical protein TCAL_07055 [Tigriopus californicus]|eukprot:TCALIF_07055-PA protein Name:"Similar to ddx20 Probable ATP-dependent RNA helicase DDX20 (Danio rerio)" AED:0.11 eAED:0.11 QI:146/1/1/1/1/1/2/74/745
MSASTVIRLAHDIREDLDTPSDPAWSRTQDVLEDELKDKTFAHFQFAKPIQFGLANAGFVRPSPIQWRALPVAQTGLDMIVQAKSGTGKTLVYVLAALHRLDVTKKAVQTLVLAPTREIAVQGARVALEVGSGMPGLKAQAFIGGTPLADDVAKVKSCHVAVGSPGRIKQLLMERALKPDAIKLFVLDEADRLMDGDFLSDVRWIAHRLPERKQVMALSATYPDDLAQIASTLMHQPNHVRLGQDDQVLHGVAQFVRPVRAHPQVQRQVAFKLKALLDLLASVSFNQCLVFSNYSVRAQAMCEKALAQGWPAVFISASQDQSERLQAISCLKQFQCRILFSTDLTARGIDAQNVDLVINVDVPWDASTYLHRIGRAGRFGSRGLTVTLAAEGDEYDNLRKIVFHTKAQIVILANVKDLPENFDLWTCDRTKMCLLEGKECDPDETAGFRRRPKKEDNTSKDEVKTESNSATKIDSSQDAFADLQWVKVPEEERVLNKPVTGLQLLGHCDTEDLEDDGDYDHDYEFGLEEEEAGIIDDQMLEEDFEEKVKNASTLLKSFFFVNNKRTAIKLKPGLEDLQFGDFLEDVKRFKKDKRITKKFEETVIPSLEIPNQVQEAADLYLQAKRSFFERESNQAEKYFQSLKLEEVLNIVKNREEIPEVISEEYQDVKWNHSQEVAADFEPVSNFSFPYDLPHPDPGQLIPSNPLSSNDLGQWFFQWQAQVQENKQFIQDMEFYLKMKAFEEHD